MATLTRTIHLSTFAFPPPEASRLSLNEPYKTAITIPVSSTWTSGRHWHNEHVECWKVLSGANLITLNNNSVVVTGGSPTVVIPRKDCPGRLDHQKAAQEAFRIEMLAEGQSQEIEKLGAQGVEAEETTTPADGEKAIFFRNLLSVVSEPRNGILGEVLRFIHILKIYQGLDANMVILDMGPEGGNGWRAMVEEMIWWLLVGMASLVGAVFGLKPVSEAYTPGPLVSQWEEQKSK